MSQGFNLGDYATAIDRAGEDLKREMARLPGQAADQVVTRMRAVYPVGPVHTGRTYSKRTDANLCGANFTRADLSRSYLLRADCTGADFTAADMSIAYMRAANFTRARLWNGKIRRATAKMALFFDADLSGANLMQSDFLGARWNGAILDSVVNADWAVFYWYIQEGFKGMIQYRPGPGLVRMDYSVMGGYSFQENAARQRMYDDD